MAINKEQKIEILKDLVKKFKEAKSIGFSTTSTMTVEDFFGLRKNLREVGATYNISKKTFIKKAIKEALNIELDLSTMKGQIWFVCCNDDTISGFWKVNDLVKESKGEKITWSSCIFESELKNLEETKILAGLPSRDILLTRLVGSMKSPISSLARFFDAASKQIESNSKIKVSELKIEEKIKKQEKIKVETKEEIKIKK